MKLDIILQNMLNQNTVFSDFMILYLYNELYSNKQIY